METERTQRMDLSKVFCHNPDYPARGKVDGFSAYLSDTRSHRQVRLFLSWRAVARLQSPRERESCG
jgi:hypothetical protein